MRTQLIVRVCLTSKVDDGEVIEARSTSKRSGERWSSRSDDGVYLGYDIIMVVTTQTDLSIKKVGITVC